MDLKNDGNMSPVVGMLFSMVEGNHQRLISIVSDLSQVQLDYKGPSGEENSIAQLLRHLSYVDLCWVFRIQGEPVPENLEEKYGPPLNERGKLPYSEGVPLNAILKDYETVLTLLETVCLSLTDDQLDQVVEYEDGQRATIRWGIWHIADHSRYHQAHVNQLLKWYEKEQS